MSKRIKFGAVALAAALAFAPATTVSASFAPAPPAAVQDDTPPEAETDMFSKGQNLFLQGRYEQAATVFSDFLKQYPNSVITDLTLLWLGRSYMQLGKLKEAEDVGQRLRALQDTPFTEVYENELSAARVEIAARPAVRPTPPAPPPTREVAAAARPTPAAPRPTPTPRSTLVVPRPTPTPRPTLVARATPTPTPAPARARRETPSLVIRPGEEAAGRSRRRRASTPPVTARTTPPAVVRPTPTPTPARARRTPPTPTRRTPPTPARITPTPTPFETAVVRPPETRDPALTPTVPAPGTTDPVESAPLPQQPTGGSFSVVVKQVPNLNLALRRTTLAAQPGQLVQLPLAVTNTGNKDDQFRLETDLPAEFQPTFSLAPSGTDTSMPVLITSQLARDASLEVVLNLRIPDNAPDNLQRNFTVRAASQADAQVMKVVDASLTVVAAALAADATVSTDTVMPGDTFTQKISVRNQGSASARNARADFVFNPDFELVSANPSPLQYDRASSTAIWSLGELDSRDTREITVTLRAAPDALAATRPLGRGSLRTASLVIPSNFDGPNVSVGRVTRARIEAVSAGLTATPGDTIYVPFVVRNPSNYPESYALQIAAPGAPPATIYADSNGDGQHQDSEPTLTQTDQIEPRGGQFPVLLRVDIPRQTPDRQQYAYNVVTRSASARNVAGEASTVLTVAAPRVSVRTEAATRDARPGDTLFYRLVLVNNGAGLAKNLTVTEYLPNALQFVSSDPNLTPQAGTGGTQAIVWRVSELAPGDTAVLKLTVRLRPDLAADQEITPRHSLGYQDGNGNSYQGQ